MDEQPRCLAPGLFRCYTPRMAYIDILQLNPRTMLWLYTCDRCYAMVYGRSEKDCMARADGHVLWHVGGK